MSLLKENKFFFINGVFDRGPGADRLSAGVTLDTREGFELRIPDKVIIEDTVHLVFSARQDGGAPEAGTKVRIFAGVSTRLNLILHKTGSAEFSPRKTHVEIFLSENACVDLYQIEEAGVRGTFSTENSFYLKKHASLDYLVFASADGVSSTVTDVYFEEAHGFFSGRGLSMLKGKASADHLLRVNHKAGHCISRQYYKSVLTDEAKASFDSLVHVHADAAKSDSQQLNRNLLLSDRAEARSKPDLRIDNDDVAASHGSATGQLEDTELFYLESRGFSREMARLVLVDGFAGEIVGEIHEKKLKDELQGMIHRGIEAMVGGAKG